MASGADMALIMFGTIGLFLWAVLALVAWKMAKQRRLNAALYVILELLFPIIPIVYMAIKHPGPPLEEPLNNR